MSGLFSLKGKTAHVTGAGRGLGTAIACALADAGAEVICASSRTGGAAETAAALRDHGCRVSEVHGDLSNPDEVTAMAEEALALQENAARAQQILARIPAGRWGEPSDLAGAAVFLASRESEHVSGHVLVVDGGWMAR